MYLSKQPSAMSGRAADTCGLASPRKVVFCLLTILCGAGAAIAYSHKQDPDPISPAALEQSTPAKVSALEPAQGLAAPERLSPAERASAFARSIASRVGKLEAETEATLKVQKLEADITVAKADLREKLETRYKAVIALQEATEAARVRAAKIAAAAEAEAKAKVAALEQAKKEAEAQVAMADPVEPETIPVPFKRPDYTPKPEAAKPVVAQASKPAAAQSAKPSAPAAMAYASAEDPATDEKSPFSGLSKIFSSTAKNIELPGRSSGIAVYDISSATVHMPDGSKLEAHSGIGKMRDNPKFVHVRNNGPTPPNVYHLRMREKRFYGVEAIRMLPADPSAMHGRDGMLTHTNLLRGRIGSHGCVAFTNYEKFLSAFKAGKVKKLIVVPSMNELPTYMASL
ncbi:Protein of unknown function [Roseibium suaedae]|uniref:Tlde1 domain-containing protein n=1 Tax=Roseibium suaedae TaxID=735517 RepID=A0A1M7B0W4_9HYPH|nr:Protein of unknown function [Roseibium suaedae]